VLAELQAKEDDPTIDAEPARSCTKCGTERPPELARALLRHRDATRSTYPPPEVWRWTDDAALVRDLKGPAMLALDWIDKYGDRDGDGFVEYERRTERGLENQS